MVEDFLGSAGDRFSAIEADFQVIIGCALYSAVRKVPPQC